MSKERKAVLKKYPNADCMLNRPPPKNPLRKYVIYSDLYGNGKFLAAGHSPWGAWRNAAKAINAVYN